jgi:hypothetical protein
MSSSGTPGWYTLQGHHHCSVTAQGNFAPDCLCTDPKKCFGHAGTGAPYCAAHPEECAPQDKTQWCAWWYASDQKYCNLCNGWSYTGPAGSGAKPCPAGSTGGGTAPATTAASTPAAVTAPTTTGFDFSSITSFLQSHTKLIVIIVGAIILLPMVKKL